MQRARRLASVAVVASMAVTGLSACRSAPDVVAYIGTGAQLVKITTDQVAAIYDDAKAEATGPRQNTDGSVDQPTKVTRQQIVSTLIANRVLRAYGQANGLTPTALPADQVAQSMFLNTSAKFVPVYSEYIGYLQAMLAKIKQTQPTEAEVRDIFDRLVAAGGVPATTTFESWVSGLAQQDQQTISARLELKRELQPVAAKLDIDVNPRYESAFSVLQTVDQAGTPLPLIVVPVGDGGDSVPVTDAS
jgi:hypothetical protein